MADKDDPIVVHMTMRRPDGSSYHVPLRQSEADAIRKLIEAEDSRRKELMPTEESARKLFFDAYRRLKEFGWNDAIYCPKDGSTFDAIEPGSTGVHNCHYEGEWPKGSWWVSADNDVWPSRPALWRATKKEEPANGTD